MLKERDKRGWKMKKEKMTDKEKMLAKEVWSKADESVEETKIPKFDKREYSWCKHEKKVVYNPTKKLHCPYCGGKL